MPKKSKKQKIQAARRLYQSLHQPQPHHEEVRKEAVATVYSSSSTPQEEPLNEKEQALTRYFMADFKKSMILIVCVIALEIFFYFASMSTNFAWLFKF